MSSARCCVVTAGLALAGLAAMTVSAAVSAQGATQGATQETQQEAAGDPALPLEGPIDFPAYTVVGDAIPAPLTGTRGDATRGRALVGQRQQGLCLLCHAGPFPEAHLQGTLAPPLAGAGARWNEGQLRLRLVDPQRLNPDSIMPAYGAPAGRVRVGLPWQGRPVLGPQQVEDVVAYLRTLDRMPATSAATSAATSPATSTATSPATSAATSPATPPALAPALVAPVSPDVAPGLPR